MTTDEQVDLWVAGLPVHNPDRDECCPDFSCCRPQLLWPAERRRWFRDHPEDRDEMLGQALGALIADEFPEGDVHLAGAGA